MLFNVYEYLPRFVLGPARSCLNLSNRNASLSGNTWIPEELSATPPVGAHVEACGRDWDLGTEVFALELSRKYNRGEKA